MVESDDDRLALLMDFGVIAEIGSASVTVVFDNEWIDQNGISSNVPVITARTIDVEGFTRGQSVIIEGTPYTFAESPHDDGQGIVHIVLQRT